MSDSKPLILIFSDSMTAHTGFGTVNRQVFRRLKDKYTLVVLGINYSGDPLPEAKEFNIYPTIQDPYGRDRLGPLLLAYKPDLLYVLNDYDAVTWVPQTLTDARNKLQKDIPWVFYFPVDGKPIYKKYIEFLKTYVDVPFTTTKFGQDAILETDPDFKIPYVYHGVDHNLFRKLDPDIPLIEGGPTVNTEKARLGIDKTFNTLMIGVNQIRKQYNIALEAFAEFSKDKEDVRLILHCARNTNYGWDMDALIGYLSDKNESEGKQPINKKVVFTNGIVGPLGIAEQELALLYNYADVFLNTSCFVPGTKVHTNPSVKNIEDIKIGEKVLTKNGKYELVLKTFKNKYQGNILSIKPKYVPEIILTPNHKLFAIQNPNITASVFRKKVKKNNYTPQWVRSDQLLKNDYLAVPILKENQPLSFIRISDYIDGIIVKDKIYAKGRNQFGAIFKHPQSKGQLDKIKITKDLMKLFGYFIAEGCSTKDGIVFSVNTKEKIFQKDIIFLMKKLFKLKYRIVNSDRNRTTLHFNDTLISNLFLKLFDHKAPNKYLPSWLMYLDKNLLLPFVIGCWTGDGSAKVKTRTVFNMKSEFVDLSYSTTSERLAYQLFNIILKCGFLCSYHKNKREDYRLRIQGTLDKQSFYKELTGKTLKSKSNYSQSHGFMNDNFMFIPISDITTDSYDGYVYNINVETEHSYVTSVLSKNCGEGYGLPIVEAMASELPIIVHDATAMPEIVGDTALKVKTAYEYIFPFQDRTLSRPIPDKNGVVQHLETLYADKKLRETLGTKARERIISDPRFSWDYCAQEIDKKIQEGLQDNRILDLSEQEIL